MTTETNFVPERLDCRNWSEIEPLVNDILNRAVESPADLEQLLLEWSDLQSCIYEVRAHLHVDASCHTDNEETQSAYEHFQKTVFPPLKKASAEFDRKYYESPHRSGLDIKRYCVFDRAVAADIEIFREANITLETEIASLQMEHGKITGRQTVEFDGETKTLPAMAKYQESPDRTVRENAWRTVADRLLEDADAMRDLFDKMYSIRQNIADNAGFENYRDYSFRKMHRFDYDVASCECFHDAVADGVVPLYREISKQRAQTLGVDSYKPWDVAVDVKNRPPLDPFNSNVDRMVAGAQVIFNEVDPELGRCFHSLCDGESLDLETRIGKRPGGFQTTFTLSRKPFIFMNAAGLGRDFRTLLHEAGHAFHTILGGNDPLLAYRHAPIEFCEVASMSMELAALPYLEKVYPDQESIDRAKRVQLEGVLRLLCWIAQIDAFQHWLYTNKNHTHQERQNAWLALDDRFGPALDWSGLEQYHNESWQKQLHLYHYPFYYIEYGIAQLGALQIWLNHKKNRVNAIQQYKKALSIGGAEPLPELFKNADTKFDFGPKIINRLVREIESELSTIPV